MKHLQKRLGALEQTGSTKPKYVWLDPLSPHFGAEAVSAYEASHGIDPDRVYIHWRVAPAPIHL